jgi:hypothetical protein
MKYLNISLIAAVAILAAAAGILRSQALSSGEQVAAVGLLTLQEMQSVSSGNLPVDDFDDRSLVFPREAKD